MPSYFSHSGPSGLPAFLIRLENPDLNDPLFETEGGVRKDYTRTVVTREIAETLGINVDELPQQKVPGLTNKAWIFTLGISLFESAWFTLPLQVTVAITDEQLPLPVMLGADDFIDKHFHFSIWMSTQILLYAKQVQICHSPTP